MARAIEAVQAERAGRSHISPIALVELTTFSNRPSGTVDKRYYFSNVPCTYDYGNTGTDQNFWPVIVGGGDFFSGMQHLNEPDNLTSFSQEFELHLSNLPINGSPLVALLQLKNLEGARIQISQLLVDQFLTYPVDLTGLVGNEHLVFFTGRVNRVSQITIDSFTLQCTTELPSLAGSWAYASDDTKVDPQDLGKRFPRIYGKAKRTPLVSWEVGWTTTMVQDLDETETGTLFKITDGSGFPTGTFDVRIDSEEMQVSAKTDTTFTIDTRGINSTDAATHKAGTILLEIITTPKWVISDRQSDAVVAVYGINPVNGMLLRLDATLTPHTVTLNESLNGGTYTTLAFNAAQLATLLEHYQAQAAATITIPGSANSYTQKPFHITGTITDTEDEGGALDGVVTDGSSTMAAVVNGNPMTALFADPGTEALTGQTSRVWLSRTAGTAADVDIKIGTTIVGTVSSASLPANGSPPAKFEFFSLGPIGDMIIDPVGTGEVRVFGIERDISVPTQQVSQVAISASSNREPGEDADDVRDGNLSTGFGLPNDNDEISVVFADPGLSYDEQTLEIHIEGGVTGGRNYRLRVDPGTGYVTTEMLTIGHSSQATGDETYRYTTELQGETVRIQKVENLSFGEVREMTRTVTRFGSPVGTVSSSFGFGLRFFADVDGIEAPGVAYDADSGDVMIHPADIIKHWIEEQGGEDVDEGVYSSLVTSLGAAAEWGFDVRSLGFEWDEILQRMAFEARANIVPVETTPGGATDREWKMLAADNGYGFGAAAASDVITQTHDMSDEGRSIEDVASYFSFRYAFDASLPGSGNEEGFKLALDANPAVSDVPITTTIIDTADKRFGPVQSGPIAFRCIQLLATAQDVAGYMVQERIDNERRVFELRGVAWFDAIPHDVGDIVSITAPWATNATTCRIVSMAKEFTANVWTIIAVEILAVGTRT